MGLIGPGSDQSVECIWKSLQVSKGYNLGSWESSRNYSCCLPLFVSSLLPSSVTLCYVWHFESDLHLSREGGAPSYAEPERTSCRRKAGLLSLFQMSRIKIILISITWNIIAVSASRNVGFLAQNTSFPNPKQISRLIEGIVQWPRGYEGLLTEYWFEYQLGKKHL